jgi:hypothetical protein
MVPRAQNVREIFTPRLSIKGFLATAELERYHVVLTTYDTLSSEYATSQDPSSREEPSTKGKSKSLPPDAESSESDGFGGSLIARKEALLKANAKPKKTKAKSGALFEVSWLRVVIGRLPFRATETQLKTHAPHR